MIAAYLLAVVYAARAQEGSWLVTEVGPAGAGTIGGPSTGEVVSEALKKTGREVIDPDRASALFEQKHSKAPVYLEPDEVDKLQQAISEVAHHLALEDLSKAQQSLGELKALTPEVTDYLNRKMERAEQMFQSCLLMAYLMHKGGYRDRAYKQVAECARDFPGFEPDKQYYPPRIQEIFRRAAAEIDAAPPVTVYIGVTSGDQCRARINGIDWGPAPTNVPGIRAEQVRVQVDCGGAPGRIYTRKLKPGRNELWFDARFDSAVRTEGGLCLRYRDGADAEQNAVADNLTVARVLGASRVAQIDRFANRLRRLDAASGRELSSVAYLEADLPAAVAELLVSPSVAITPKTGALESSGAASEKSPKEPVNPADRGNEDQLMLWSWVGAGVSLGAVGAGWGFWVARSGEWNRRLDAGNLSDYDGYRAPILLFTGLGSLGLISCLALGLPRASGVPWWSYLVGAGGAGLAVYGIYAWARKDKECKNADCTEYTLVDKLGGPFFTMQSLPLLSVPIIYLFRSLAGENEATKTAVAALPAPGGALLSWSERF